MELTKQQIQILKERKEKLAKLAQAKRKAHIAQRWQFIVKALQENKKIQAGGGNR